MKQDIKYSYAYRDGIVVHIEDVNKSQKNEYFCISCGRLLIPRKGKVKRHHFAHKNIVNCDSEGYLHKLAKQLFYNTYKAALQEGLIFDVVYESMHICTHYAHIWNNTCTTQTKRTFDLTQSYKKAIIEKKHHGYIADILLESDDGKPPIFIEIAVSHKCDKAKIESGNKIIEYHISDESDLDILKQRRIDPFVDKISLYNFNVKTIKKDFCGGACQHKEWHWFVIYQDNRYDHFDMSVSEFDKIRSRFRYYRVFEKREKSFYPDSGLRNIDFFDSIHDSLETAFLNSGVRVPYCSLCRYFGHYYSGYWSWTCRLSKNQISDKKIAEKCNAFRYPVCFSCKHMKKFYRDYNAYCPIKGEECDNDLGYKCNHYKRI